MVKLLYFYFFNLSWKHHRITFCSLGKSASHFVSDQEAQGTRVLKTQKKLSKHFRRLQKGTDKVQETYSLPDDLSIPHVTQVLLYYFLFKCFIVVTPTFKKA